MHPPLIVVAAANEEPIAAILHDRHAVSGKLLRDLATGHVRLGEHRRDRRHNDGTGHG
jgi:hypothetical protein